MRHVQLAAPTDFAGWRAAARTLCAEGVAPERVTWAIPEMTESLLVDERPVVERPVGETDAGSFSVPREFLELARTVVLHSDPQRFALLYRLLWRVRAEPRLLGDALDEDVHRAQAMHRAVYRDIHKMHAFLRFREVMVAGLEPRTYMAWFEPQHHILEAAAPFFVERFPNARWAIVTPLRRALWDGQRLSFGSGGSRAEVPAQDASEALWRQYYASIFNPARLNLPALHLRMPRRYWRNLPETQVIPQLVGTAHTRTLAMIDKAPGTQRRIRTRAPRATSADAGRTARAESAVETTLEELRDRARGCRACPLWRNATQTVFGEGPAEARIVLVGEQPGDQEDLQGRPFVGPAGRLLDRALAQAEVARTATYVTNAVKHFKFEPRGKRRLHKKPNELEITACEQWLDRELELLRPALIVALGATAARAVLGRATPIEKNRGRILPAAAQASVPGADILVTIHPSFLLRMPDEDRAAGFERFVADLRLARPYAAA